MSTEWQNLRSREPALAQRIERITEEVVDDIANGYCQSVNNPVRARRLIRKQEREIRREVRARCREELRGTVGFFTLNFVLMTLIGAVVQWAIKRWLDKRYSETEA